MNIVEIAQSIRRMQEEERRKKECEPYEEIIRKLRQQDKERAMLIHSPPSGRS